MGNCIHRSRGDGGAAHCGKNSAALALALAEEEEMHRISEKAPAPVKEVKIRITRKQLEDLLRRLDGKRSGGGAVVVSQLLRMTSRGQSVQWRPALQSIPE